MKILLVDDHILFRQGLSSLLKSQTGFDVIGEAGSVLQAIEMARTLKPDLVLMDFSLPDGTGLEATQAILKQDPSCKIVFLTVYETDDKLLAAMRLGAKGYLLKNVPIANLLASLQALERGEPAISRLMAGRIIEEFVRMENPVPGNADALNRLSRREREILQEVSKGQSNQEIANRLFISENTVKHHVHSILAKLELHDRREATSYAKSATIRNNTTGSEFETSG